MDMLDNLLRYFEAASRPMPMESRDLARALTALSHGLSLQRPANQPGSPNPVGRAIDSLLKLLVLPQAGA